MNFTKEESIVESWIARRKLSAKNLDYLEQEYEQGLQVVPAAVCLMTAGEIYSQELELPNGSYWLQVIASLLDQLRPANDTWTRLNFLNKELETYGFIEKEHIK